MGRCCIPPPGCAGLQVCLLVFNRSRSHTVPLEASARCAQFPGLAGNQQTRAACARRSPVTTATVRAHITHRKHNTHAIHVKLCFASIRQFIVIWIENESKFANKAGSGLLWSGSTRHPHIGVLPGVTVHDTKGTQSGGGHNEGLAACAAFSSNQIWAFSSNQMHVTCILKHTCAHRNMPIHKVQNPYQCKRRCIDQTHRNRTEMESEQKTGQLETMGRR